MIRCIRCGLSIGIMFLFGLPATIAAERFTAVAVNMTNRSNEHRGPIEIVINRWSTSDDRDALAIADQESGMQAVVERLHDGPRIGYLRFGKDLGEDVTFARDVQRKDGSRRIVIVLVRELQRNELFDGAPTLDYPFTVVELILDRNGRGRGTLTPRVRVKVHKGSDQMDVEKFSGGAVVLNDLKVAADK